MTYTVLGGMLNPTHSLTIDLPVASVSFYCKNKV